MRVEASVLAIVGGTGGGGCGCAVVVVLSAIAWSAVGVAAGGAAVGAVGGSCRDRRFIQLVRS